MDHDVKAVANVFYKLAREDKRYLTNLEYQKCVCLAQDLSFKVLGEELFSEPWRESVVGRIVPSLYNTSPANGWIKRRWETRTPPIEVESPAWKVIRAAWMQFDYEQRHGTSAHNETAIHGIQ